MHLASFNFSLSLSLFILSWEILTFTSPRLDRPACFDFLFNKVDRRFAAHFVHASTCSGFRPKPHERSSPAGSKDGDHGSKLVDGFYADFTAAAFGRGF